MSIVIAAPVRLNVEHFCPNRAHIEMAGALTPSRVIPCDDHLPLSDT
jgi:hypothetical protein